MAAVVSKNCGAVAKLQLASRWPQKNNSTEQGRFPTGRSKKITVISIAIIIY